LFWIFKLSIDVDILANYGLVTFLGNLYQNLGDFFSKHLVTLPGIHILINERKNRNLVEMRLFHPVKYEFTIPRVNNIL
jgi:hypothetical protein